MSIKKIVDKIKSLDVEGKDELIGGIESLYHGLNDENKTLRKEKETVVNKLKNFSGVDDDVSDVDSIFDALSNDTKSSKATERKLQKMQKQLDAMLEEKQNLERKALEGSRNDAIMKKLAQSGVRKDAIDGMAEMFANISKLDDDGEWIIGDADLSTGIEGYLEKNQYLLDSKQKAGSGTQPPRDGKGDGFKYISGQDAAAMSHDERVANLDAIKKSRDIAAKENKTW